MKKAGSEKENHRLDQWLVGRAKEGDDAATEMLNEKYQFLFKRLIRRFGSSFIPDEDLKQECSLALLDAVGTYNLNRQASFLTWLYFNVQRRIIEYSRYHSSVIRISVEVQKRYSRIRRTADAIEAATGLPPTLSEISDWMELPVQKISEALDNVKMAHPFSFTGNVNHGHCLFDTTGDLTEFIPGEEDIRDRTIDAVEVRNALAKLNPRHRHIIERLADGYSQADIAREMEISPSRVKQLYDAGREEFNLLWELHDEERLAA